MPERSTGTVAATARRSAILVILACAAGGTCLPAIATADAPAALPPLDLVALTDRGHLIRFNTRAPEAATARPVAGTADPLIGIDCRPADGKLYTLTTTNDLYVVDAGSGQGALRGSLTRPFDGAERSGFDFTPQADRLRLIGPNGENLRVNVDHGATAIDTAVAYGLDDAHAGRRPLVAGVGYTNNVAEAPTTVMYDLDVAQDVLALQDPPNDGTLTTVGPLGHDFDARTGFEIVTLRDGTELGLAAHAGVLYAVDLASGAATPHGRIGAVNGGIVGLTVAECASPPEAQ